MCLFCIAYDAGAKQEKNISLDSPQGCPSDQDDEEEDDEPRKPMVTSIPKSSNPMQDKSASKPSSDF